MNVLFLSLVKIHSIREHGIYPDVLRQFLKNGHEVFVLSPEESAGGQAGADEPTPGAHIIPVRVGKIQKTNVIQKGLNMVLIETRLIRAIKKHLRHVRFDLVLYATPPVTFAGAVRYVKARDGARAYLMLKDIHPQSAVDLGALKTKGILRFVYRYFLRKERQLYQVSDRIGCMSQANIDYLLRNDPELPVERIELLPNSIEVRDLSQDAAGRDAVRDRYGLPKDRKIFIYGGNLGLAQGIPFLMDCLRVQAGRKDAFFLVIGSGTEYGKLEAFFDQLHAANLRLMRGIPKDDFDRMTAACDVGLIFLDHRFTIPNFPSRLLSYMQAKLPVLASTDPNTDVGRVITGGGFGWWCESDDVGRFGDLVDECVAADTAGMGETGYRYLLDHYTAEQTYQTIMAYFKQGRG